jgi:hypothetical protein
MPFEEKLRRTVDRATDQGLRRLQSRTKKIADHVSRVLRTWEPGTTRDLRDLDGVIEEARKDADLVDAAMLVRDRVLDAANGRIHTLQIKRDLKEVQDQNLMTELAVGNCAVVRTEPSIDAVWWPAFPDRVARN